MAHLQGVPVDKVPYETFSLVFGKCLSTVFVSLSIQTISKNSLSLSRNLACYPRAVERGRALGPFAFRQPFHAWYRLGFFHFGGPYGGSQRLLHQAQHECSQMEDHDGLCPCSLRL